jgi:hypothetical protein
VKKYRNFIMVKSEKYSMAKRGHMDIISALILVHLTLIDAQVVGMPVMD